MIIISVASDERLKEFAGFVRNNSRLTKTQISAEQDLTPSTVNRYFRACREKGYLDDNEIPTDDSLSDTPDLNQIIEQTKKKMPRGSDQSHDKDKTIKVGLGDLHLSDEDAMLESIESTTDNLIDFLNKQDHKNLKILNIGDIVSGTGIFYGQEYRNITSKSHWQTILGTYYLKKITERIKDETQIEYIHFDNVKGNHDVANQGTNLAYYLTRDMQAYDLSAKYRGNYHISDNIYQVHGYGRSSYRPQSPAFLRDMSNRVANLNNQGKDIDRVLSGHCHWLDVDFQYTLSVSFDMVGGFQRNARQELGRLQRPAGFIAYLPNKSPKKIKPDPDVFRQEANDEELEFKNVTRIGNILKEAYEYEEFATK